ncbi:hypothetical protein ACWOAH_02550 [Vagococcus vulneris]|uniref:Lipoprotein n=1 Tax=Vagococcus vulneris TaxID=1977869 RepID=A0A430A107_9ENTE|nr:hypothetical protein [Vagococcus vulneris]RSU00063.1 hypothetical protein CBF37_01815 [Vagococcus vulneris]
MKKIAVLYTSMILLLSGCSTKEVKETGHSENYQNQSSSVVTTSTSLKKVNQLTTETVNSETNKTASLNTKLDNQAKVSLSLPKTQYTLSIRQDISDAFYQWAGGRAKIGGMAVSKEFFDHGAAGVGDWFAVTPDGLAMAQTFDHPGYDGFPLHIVGGVTFYYSKDGVLGMTDEIKGSSFAEGFSGVARTDKPIIKYILVDNGNIYELDSDSSLTTGFYEADEDGTIKRSQINEVAFKQSEDKDAIEEYQRLLGRLN